MNSGLWRSIDFEVSDNELDPAAKIKADHRYIQVLT